MRYWFLILFIPVLSIQAQQLNDFALREDSLAQYLTAMRKAKKEAERIEWNKKFKHLLAETLKMDNVFNYPFDSIKGISNIYAPDRSMRIINWNLEHENFTHTYYCYVLVPKANSNKCSVIEFNDQRQAITEPANKTLDNKKWLGALYYEIILNYQNGRKEYIVLGWDGNNHASHKKIIDVMIVNGEKIQMGSPIFYMENGAVNKRIILEYSSRAQISLKYKAKEKLIFFDHLEPETPMAEGIYEFYFPDGYYDGFVLEDGKWKFKSNVDVRRDKDYKDKFWKDPNNK